MKPDPTPEVHPISYSLWARGSLLSPLSTMAVTDAGQETLPSTVFSPTAFRSSAQGPNKLHSTGQAALSSAAPGGALFYSLPWREDLK